MTASILLVEDDLAEAGRLQSALSHLGYSITLAHDGDAALSRLKQERFDAVLLDLVLPGLDGMGLLSALKVAGIRVPVVVAVTPSGLEGARSALKAGARDFVVKPAGALRLEVALANAVAQGRIEDEGAGTRPAPAPDNVVRLADRLPARTEPEPAGHPLLDAGGHVRALSTLEEEAIRFACAHYGGHMSEVARRLGIGRSTLYRKLAGIGLPTGELVAPQFVAAE